MVLNENTPFAAVNQRVLGSSPRGGASKASRKTGFFVFNPIHIQKYRLL